MTTVIGPATRHTVTDLLCSVEGHPGEGAGRILHPVTECPRCRVLLPPTGYCDECREYVALG